MGVGVKVKFCGLRTVEDYLCAWKLGVDYVGFVCYEKSPRAIRPEQIRDIMERGQEMMSEGNQPNNILDHIPDKPTAVALFVDWDVERVLDAIEIAKIEIAQVYDESIVAALPIPHWNVRRIASDDDLRNVEKEQFSGEALLLDSAPTRDQKITDESTVYGGTGHSFDWRGLEQLDKDKLGIPYFIAGGINEDNVRSLLRYKPYGIDISSGIERSRGVKDHELMKRIIDIINN